MYCLPYAILTIKERQEMERIEVAIGQDPNPSVSGCCLVLFVIVVLWLKFQFDNEYWLKGKSSLLLIY